MSVRRSFLVAFLLAAAPSVAHAAPADLAGLVDIGGGRRLYLECRGTGSPTVLLEAGYRASARFWSEDLRQPQTPRPMVLPVVAAVTRVCAYDRPGTYAALDADLHPSRSDPVPHVNDHLKFPPVRSREIPPSRR